MTNGFGFTRLVAPPGNAVTIVFEDQPLQAWEGESVAAALLAAGHAVTRTTPVSGSARGPFCLMGTCFECLVEIDGQPNRQACAVQVREGLQVRRMDGARWVSEPCVDD